MKTAEKTKNKNLGWLAGIGLFLATKLKWLFGLLKFGKVATLVSMFVSLGAYAMFYGWKFAAGLIYLIFIHEMGHLVAAKKKGIPTTPALFIPFMGAAIGINPKKIKDAKTEAYIAYGGPLFGLLSIVPIAILYYITKDPYWALMAQVGALINLFNLFPVSPLDGGRIVTVLSTKIWFIGLMILVPFVFVSPDPILFLILIFGLFTWWHRFRESHRLKIKHYEKEKTEKFINQFEKYDQEFQSIFKTYNPVRDRDIKDWTFDSCGHAISDYVNSDRKVKKEKRFYFPVFQDKQRLNLEKLKIDKEIAKQKIDLFGIDLNDVKTKNNEISLKTTSINWSDIAKKVKDQKALLNEIKEEIDKAGRYYQTTLKTKVAVLTLYIGLAVILAFILVEAMAIMAENKDLILKQK